MVGHPAIDFFVIKRIPVHKRFMVGRPSAALPGRLSHKLPASIRSVVSAAPWVQAARRSHPGPLYLQRFSAEGGAGWEDQIVAGAVDEADVLEAVDGVDGG